MANPSSVWHPYTQMSEWDEFTKIVRGKDMWLIDSEGHRMLDGVASMWCNVWGHSKKELISAIHRQSRKSPHTSLFNLTHPEAESLAKNLVSISPNMNRVFYSDNGSTAMEIAFKIAIQYWQNVNNPARTRFVSWRHFWDNVGRFCSSILLEVQEKYVQDNTHTVCKQLQNSKKNKH
jgi:adenosylmethionine-8-amino-7-oxononanoate aminotransferase